MVVGVGYLVSLVHNAAYWLLQCIPNVAQGSLETKLDLFALVSIALLTVAGCAWFWWAARRSNILRNEDYLLLALTTLVPIYATRLMGFDYCLMADYHFLNMVLCLATLLVFQVEWRRPASEFSTWRMIALGAFVGSAAANKITLLAVVLVTLIPNFAQGRLSAANVLKRCSLAFASATAAFTLVHACSYLFNFKALLTAIPIWWHFVSNPGGETAFWKTIFSNFLRSFSYSYIIYYSIGGIVLSTTFLIVRREFDRRTTLVSLYCLLGLVANAYFVIKRPAGSTLFDSVLFTLLLSSILLTVASHHRIVRLFIGTAVASWTLYAVGTFDVSHLYEVIANSRDRSEAKWQAFQRVQQMSAGRPIEVIFPDNSYHHEGVFELLLKGASDFPTWNITSGRHTVLDRYSPHTTYRHNYGGLSPNAPYPGDSTLVWFDLPNAAPLTTQYPALGQAISRPDVRLAHWKVYTRGGLDYVIMHVAVRNQKAITQSIVSQFTAKRVSPTVALLHWTASEPMAFDIEFRQHAGAYAPLGVTGEGARDYRVGDISATAAYDFRIRPHGSHSAATWVEAALPSVK